MKHNLVDETGCAIKMPQKLSFITFFAGIGVGLLAWTIIHFIENTELVCSLLFTVVCTGVLIITHYEKLEDEVAFKYYYYYLGLDLLKNIIKEKDSELLEKQKDFRNLQADKENVLHKCNTYYNIIMKNKTLLAHEFIEEHLVLPNYDSNGKLKSSTTFVNIKLKDEITNKQA